MLGINEMKKNILDSIYWAELSEFEDYYKLATGYDMKDRSFKAFWVKFKFLVAIQAINRDFEDHFDK
jgi:hypothetical protein